MRSLANAHPPAVAQEYAQELRKRLGSHARQIILFGSQARGDSTTGSDYDFIVVVDERTRALQELVLDAGARMLDEADALCAALVYDEAEWQKARRFPLGWNVEREGVML